MPSRIGFFLFAGLIGGSLAGHFLIGAPAVGAVACALAGLIAAILLDRREEKRLDGDEG